jgi:hypothetical protein
MFILIAHQLGNPDAAVIAQEEDGKNIVFATREAAEDYAADSFLGVFDFSVLEI